MPINKWSYSSLNNNIHRHYYILCLHYIYIYIYIMYTSIRLLQLHRLIYCLIMYVQASNLHYYIARCILNIHPYSYIRGRANVQSTQKWEVNNLFVQSIFQFCAVHFSMLSNNICIILINVWRHYVRYIPCG